MSRLLGTVAGAVPQMDLFETTDQQWDAGMAARLSPFRLGRARDLGRKRDIPLDLWCC
jgi:hypothetical protein